MNSRPRGKHTASSPRHPSSQLSNLTSSQSPGWGLLVTWPTMMSVCSLHPSSLVCPDTSCSPHLPCGVTWARLADKSKTVQETPSDRGDRFPIQTPVCSARQTGRGRTQLLSMSVYYFPVGALRSLEYRADFQNGGFNNLPS